MNIKYQNRMLLQKFEELITQAATEQDARKAMELEREIEKLRDKIRAIMNGEI